MYEQYQYTVTLQVEHDSGYNYAGQVITETVSAMNEELAIEQACKSNMISRQAVYGKAVRVNEQ